MRGGGGATHAGNSDVHINAAEREALNNVANAGYALATDVAKSNELVNTEITNLKKSVSDSKSTVATAVTAMGVSTAADAAFSTIATNVRKITPTLSQNGQTITASNNGVNAKTLTVSSGALNNPSGTWSGATLTMKSTVKTAGYVLTTAQTSGTVTITTSAAKTITPGKTAQTVVSSGNRIYFSGNLTVASLGGNAVARDVLEGTTFSSDNAGRAVSGAFMALRLNRLLGNYKYMGFEGFANGYSSQRDFERTLTTNTPVYIRFYSSHSNSIMETVCRAGSNITVNNWQFNVYTTYIKMTYRGSGSNIYIQLMAYTLTYGLGNSSFAWYQTNNNSIDTFSLRKPEEEIVQLCEPAEPETAVPPEEESIE